MGRQKEFEEHGAHWKEGKFPNPESVDTFEKSKLRWEEVGEKSHASILALYRSCLIERKNCLLNEPLIRGQWEVAAVGEFLVIRYRRGSNDFLLVVAFKETEFPLGVRESIFDLPSGKKWTQVMTSEDFDIGHKSSGGPFTPVWKIKGPGAIWLKSTLDLIPRL